MKNVSIFSARSNCPGNRCHLLGFFYTPPNSCEATVVTVSDDLAAADDAPAVAVDEVAVKVAA